GTAHAKLPTTSAVPKAPLHRSIALHHRSAHNPVSPYPWSVTYWNASGFPLFGTSKAMQTFFDCPALSFSDGFVQGFLPESGIRLVCLPVSPPLIVSWPCGSASS